MSQSLLLHLLVFSCCLLLTRSQPSRCNGVVSFEKISRREPDPNKFASNGVLLDEPGHAVAIECLASCLRQPNCFGLTVDYGRSRCSSFGQPLDSSGDFVNSANNFFQKVCYRNISLPSCGPYSGRRVWTIDRSLGALMEGFVAREFKTTHRLGCSKECLTETSFNCSSASYERLTGRCLLSKESRRTQPQAFRDTYLNGSWTYMENNCIETGSDCAYDRKKNRGVTSVDLLMFANDVDHCETLCRNLTQFLCRSFSFQNNKCFLSSDDRVSSTHLTLPAVTDSTYGELVCPSDDCTHGAYFYEKVIGHSLETGEEEVIPVPPLECESACNKMGFTCRAAAVDYAKGICLKLDRMSQGRSAEFKPLIGRTFMEKTCLHIKNASSSDCSHGSVAFIRVPGIELPASAYSKSHELIPSRQECQQKCWDESSFKCKSAFYDEGTALCKLSAVSLHSLPRPEQITVNANYKTSHMENICGYDKALLPACDAQKRPGQRIIYVDRIFPDVSSVAECQSLCRERNDCQSFGYNQETRTCSLSSVSSRIPNLVVTVKGSKHDYYEFDCSKSPSSGTTTPSSNLSTAESTTTVTASVGTDGTGFRTNMSSTTSLPMPSLTPTIPDVPATVTTVSTTTTATTETQTIKTTLTAKPAETTTTETTGSSTSSPGTTTTSVPLVTTIPPPSITSTEVSRPITEDTTPATTTTTTTTTSQIERNETTVTQTVSPSSEPVRMTTSSMSPSSLTSPGTTTDSSSILTVTTGSARPSSAAMSGTTDPATPQTSTTAAPTTATTTVVAISSPPPSSIQTTTTATTTPSSTVPPTSPSPNGSTKTPSTANASTTLSTTTATASKATTVKPSNVSQIPAGRESCPKNYASTYERIPGFEPIGDYYFTILCGSDPGDPGIVYECSILCSERRQCRGFVVDYQNYLCYGLIAEDVIHHFSLCVSETKDFYQRICIPSSLSCERMFTFDRILDQAVEYSSVIPRYTIPFISKDACKCLCLEEKKFTCHSMSYEVRNNVCRIYDQSRTRISLTFSQGSEFFENTCASPASACSYIRPETDIGPSSIMKSLSVRSLYECKWACDSSRSFHCRSFNFVDRVFGGAATNLCLLYSDNQMTARKGSLKHVPRSLYYQKVCT